MRLVEGIADRWGVEDGTDGKRVWFELAPRGGREAAAVAPGLPTAAPGDGRGDPSTQEETA